MNSLVGGFFLLCARRRHRSSSSNSSIRISLFFLSGLEDLERTHQSVIDTHHSTSIVKLSTVVGSREDGDELSLGEELISVLDNLMGTTHEIQVVFVEELGHNIVSKGERHSAVVLTPPIDVLLGVTPEEITQDTRVGDISRAHDAADLLHGVVFGRKSSVHAKDLLVNDSGDGKAVKAISESLPKLNVVSSLTLIIEAVYAVNRGTLVVSAQQEKVLRVLDLVREQEADGFQTLLATVDIVTEEEVVGIGRESSVLEQTKEVIVLPMNITHDFDGSFELQKDRLRDEHLSRLEAKLSDLRFGEVHELSRALAAHVEESRDDVVNVKLGFRHCDKDRLTKEG